MTFSRTNSGHFSTPATVTSAPPRRPSSLIMGSPRPPRFSSLIKHSSPPPPPPSSSMSQFTYHVFLSFRGEDTRKTFTDHLYTALLQAGFRTFKDNDGIEKGEKIESELRKAIEESKISIIIFSKGYASSRWCLDELVKILERKQMARYPVIPVFYDIVPSQVRNLTGCFGEGFSALEEELPKVEDDEKKREWTVKVEGWRAALREAADMGGLVLQNEAGGHESKFIQSIVKEVGNKLNRTILDIAPYMVGLESRVNEINAWLHDGANDLRKVVICGMGGVGKTTIAKTIYNLNFDKFEARSFLANIREVSMQPNGFVRLQEQLISDTLKGRKEKIYNTDEGIFTIEEATCCKKVLLVLDDVDEGDQIHKILGWRQWFHPGIKIIITTRNEQLLKCFDRLMVPTYVKHKMFKVKELDNDESLQLFSLHAFGHSHPTKCLMELSKRALRQCGGLPLGLQILGSSLSGRNIDYWESTLSKLESIPCSQIQSVLKISYDSLSDDHDRNLFLDIACFFIGKDKDYVVKILDKCDFYTTSGIQNLVDRCLLTINRDNKLTMHQLLQDMGREIVRQESPKEPGKRSRLWCFKDALNVLQEETGSKKIEGLVLDLHVLNEDKLSKAVPGESNEDHNSIEHFPHNTSNGNFLPNYWDRLKAAFARSHAVSNELDLKTDALARMHRLRLLQLNYVQLSGGYKEFPRALRWLCWHGFPLKIIPDDFRLENLVVLEMCNSSLEQTWKGTRILKSLKILDLSHSHCLLKTPDFSGLPDLEIMMLKDCTSLIEVHESIGDLKRFVTLNLEDCKSLRKLPRSIAKLKSLKKLILSGCSELDELPEMENMESLTILHADGIALNQVSSDNGDRFLLHKLHRYLTSPRKAPQSINFTLVSLPLTLVSLSLAKSNLADDAIPRDLSILHSLHYLNLSGNPISILPEGIKDLSMLQSLQLDNCTRLQSLPELPPSLKNLFVEGCTSLERIENLPNFFRSLHLEIFSGGKLVVVKGMFKLEPIKTSDAQMINDVGLLNLETRSISVKLANNMIYTERQSPLQGLYECGVFRILLSRSEVPNRFNHLLKKSFISFEVPRRSGHEIQGLNMCIMYLFPPFWGGRGYFKITNKTKSLNWTNNPTSYGIPTYNESTLWLSHMRFKNHELQAGDEVTVSVKMGEGFWPNEFGVHFVFKEDEELEIKSDSEGKVLPGVNEEDRTEDGKRVKEHVNEEDRTKDGRRVGKHLLCHHLFASHRKNLKRKNGNILSGFDICFLGSANCWPVIGNSRPRLDSVWAPTAPAEEPEEPEHYADISADV